MTFLDASSPECRELSRHASRLTTALREFESLSLAVSHDFRVPLRIIDDAARALCDGPCGVDVEVRRGARAVQDGLRLIETMMADLDEFCRSGVRPLALEIVDMQALVREVWEALGARERVLLAVGKLPAAHGDLEMLRMVWRHLLETAAARCADGGHGRIVVNGSETAAFSVYSVHDNGTELALDYPGKLHQSFEQIQTQSTHSGRGVALAIVQRLVTRHRGNVWVEASPEKGTLFQFSIGAVEAQAPPTT